MEFVGLCKSMPNFVLEFETLHLHDKFEIFLGTCFCRLVGQEKKLSHTSKFNIPTIVMDGDVIFDF